MAILYKLFPALRTVFYALFLIFLTITGTAHASSPLFIVQDVKVDVTDDNALEAKNKAFAQAQMEAFQIMAERMLSEQEITEMQPPELSLVSTLIQDFEVTKEQLSTVRYVGTYTFRFKDDAVRRYFKGQGLDYTDVGSRPVLILPFYQEGEKAVLWSRYNPWMKAWNTAQDNMNGLVPVVVPMGDLADVRDIGDDQALSYSELGLSKMLTRYDAGEAALAIAVPSPELVGIRDGSQSVKGSYTIHLYRTDQAGPEYVKEIRVTSYGNDTLDALLQEAVRDVNSALQRDWKKKTLVRAGDDNRLQVKVRFKTMQEWVETQKALNRVYGISDVVLKSLSPKDAMVDIVFQGTEARLRLALQQADMVLAAPRIDVSSMVYNQNKYSAKPLVYELYMKPKGSSPF